MLKIIFEIFAFSFINTQLPRYIQILLLILMFALCYVGFLMYANSLCMQRCDEARCALQAYAMNKNQ